CALSSNIPLSLKRVLHQDSILAFGAGGKQGDGTTNQFLDSSNIFDRLRRQIRPGAGVGGRLLPTLDGLIDRLYPRLRALADRQMVDLLAVQPIADADLDAVEAIENIELGQRQAVDAAGADGLPHQHRVEPAGAPLAPGVDAEFLATAADLLADLVLQLGWKRPLADPGRVGLADAQNVANAARADACS